VTTGNDAGADGRDVAEPEVSDAPSWTESARGIGAAAFLLVFAAGTTWMATDFGDEARRLPLVVGIPLTIMAIMNLVTVVRQELARLRGTDTTTPPDPAPSVSVADQDPDDPDPVAMLRAAQDAGGEIEDTGEGISFGAALLALAVVTGLFFMLGLIPATVIFTLGYMLAVGRESWVRALSVTAVLVFVFWIFRTLLNVRFYQGWLVTEDHIPYLLPF
jgi:hypothetical protein